MNIVKRKLWDDKALIIAFNSGDEQAFSHIFETYYSALCFFTTKIIESSGHAEDIVQDVLYKLWNKRADFSDPVSVKAFLYISCKNASLNYLAKEKNKDIHKKELLLRYGESEDPVLNEMIYAESLREISTAMDHLPEQCGAVMKMLFQDGLKPQEVADQLGITVSTVYNQKSRGIFLLKQKLALHSFVLLALYLSEKFIN